MPVNKEELFKKLSDAVVDMNEEATVSLAKEIVAKNVDAYEAVEKGLWLSSALKSRDRNVLLQAAHRAEAKFVQLQRSGGRDLGWGESH